MSELHSTVDASLSAQQERAFVLREKAEEMIDLAFNTLKSILSDQKASASVRLRAALAVVKIVTTPVPPQKRTPVPANSENLHNSAQSAQRETKIGRNDLVGSNLKSQSWRSKESLSSTPIAAI